MIVQISHRAWLLALIGASFLTCTPRFVKADSDSDDSRGGERQERFHERREDRDRDNREEHRQRDDRDEGMHQERERKHRNMHPELQIAAPFNKGSDS